MATTAKVIVPDTKAKGQKRRKPLSKAELDALDDQRYRAQDFVRWLELELAPPAKPKPDCGLVYSVVGAGPLALVG